MKNQTEIEPSFAELSFEEAVARLEQIVVALESGNQPLNQCLKQYEEAVGLFRHCSDMLSGTEQRIQLLTAEGGLQISDLTMPRAGEAVSFD